MQELERYLIGEYLVTPHSATGSSAAGTLGGGRLPAAHARIAGAARPAAADGPKVRRVHPDGIRFLGMRYIDPTLAAYVGEDVMLRYDPATWPRCGCFTRIASYAGRSARSWPGRPWPSAKLPSPVTAVAGLYGGRCRSVAEWWIPCGKSSTGAARMKRSQSRHAILPRHWSS